MRWLRFLVLIAVWACAALSIFAQKAEITISLNEQFFDVALDAVFEHGGPLEFSIAQNAQPKAEADLPFMLASFGEPSECRQTIQLLRETGGVKTSVKFRDGRSFAPMAFTGHYEPPFIGCVPFSGTAQTSVVLEFDQPGQRLLARAKVTNVSLNGTGGVGGSLVAKMVQGSVDKKINPIEIISLEKLSFPIPLKGSENLKMKAVSVRYELQNGLINIVVGYDFV